jgi:hypothetical protein
MMEKTADEKETKASIGKFSILSDKGHNSCKVLMAILIWYFTKYIS